MLLPSAPARASGTSAIRKALWISDATKNSRNAVKAVPAICPSNRPIELPESNNVPITVIAVPSRLHCSEPAKITPSPISSSVTPTAAPISKEGFNARIPAETAIAPNDMRMLIASVPVSREASTLRRTFVFAEFPLPHEAGDVENDPDINLPGPRQPSEDLPKPDLDPLSLIDPPPPRSHLRCSEFGDDDDRDPGGGCRRL